MNFKVHSKFEPTTEQERVIDEISTGILKGEKFQTLLGITGSGKTYIMAKVMERTGRPSIVLTHNKTLVAQLYEEFSSFFPDNLVEYYVSHFDYFQPESYMPTIDKYIEKDSSINEELQRLRISAASSLTSGRRDVCIVSSVSCIFGAGNPKHFKDRIVNIKVGQKISQHNFLHLLTGALYSRALDTTEFKLATFIVKGDTIIVNTSHDSNLSYRIIFFGNEIESIDTIEFNTGKELESLSECTVYPASVIVLPDTDIESILCKIEEDAKKQHDYFIASNLPTEAARILQRTLYDVEMIRELGYCNGMENYGSYFDGRLPGDRSFCIMDYFPDDYIMFIDECVYAESKIMIYPGYYMLMKDVYEDETITHVVSYNEKLNIYENKKILRKMRKRFKIEDYWIEITAIVENKSTTLRVTNNHKIWTKNRGYVKADELLLTDIIKFDTGKLKNYYRTYKASMNQINLNIKCPTCNQIFTNNGNYAIHQQSIIEYRKCKNINCKSILEINKTDFKLNRYCSSKCSKTSPDKNKNTSDRLKLKNPMHNKETCIKVGKSISKTWHNTPKHEQDRRLKIFKNAPLYNKNKITSLEKLIIDLNIEDIKFTGNGIFWLSFKNKKKKNPDFKIKGQRKVIEVGDTAYWHTLDEINDTIEQYKKINFECLYLTDKDLLNDYDNSVIRITKFIYNHDVNPVKIKKIQKYDRDKDNIIYKYDLEVEDNHNFFADSILISNCHVTIPQVKAMYGGNRSRKDNLVSYGFRLPSTYDNRPLFYDEFISMVNQSVFVSATPSKVELELCQGIITEIVTRPTGILDPTIEVKPTTNCIDDLIHEIRTRIKMGDRTLVTIPSKKLSESLTKHLYSIGINCRYIHSDIETIERTQILHDLRSGKTDVVIGINLLREGLDLPEVSLVAILDADKEGFLRDYTSMIQTIGRAARNLNGHVIMYADRMTDSMKSVIAETNRRRSIQEEFNKKNNIIPTAIKKELKRISITNKEGEDVKLIDPDKDTIDVKKLTEKELIKYKAELMSQMLVMAKALEFIEAGKLKKIYDKVLIRLGELNKNKKS